MALGDGFSPSQRLQIDKAIRAAEMVCRIEFSVFVGACDGPSRPYAERLHAALVAPERSVLVLVDPTARAIEIVTGESARSQLDDHAVTLAIAEMQSDFLHGDLVGGIVRGLNLLASSARRPRTLHV